MLCLMLVSIPRRGVYTCRGRVGRHCVPVLGRFYGILSCPGESEPVIATDLHTRREKVGHFQASPVYEGSSLGDRVWIFEGNSVSRSWPSGPEAEAYLLGARFQGIGRRL
ncbi:unnamed protein product [Polarella glacialis]|uniref:Uncharacterized protein n=1 Tax=Polarella glacialis TaxID=89957 RepID=A0A813DPS9_POLGL|nr:unnamed protein product [Polarella glacialis]